MKDALGHGSDGRGGAHDIARQHGIGTDHLSRQYPITKLSDSEFKKYAAKANSDFRQRMVASGHQYFPSLGRWFPAGTKISGHKPE